MTDIKKVIKGVHDARKYLEDREWVDKSVGVHIDALNDALTLLKEQPEIVRCKDCRWYDEKISFCDNCHLPREQTFFCADGKRR